MSKANLNKQQKTTEHKPDKQPKTTEQKPDKQSKTTGQKPDKQQKAPMIHKVDKQKAPEHKATKHEQPKPKVVSKVDKQKAPEHKVTKHEQPAPKVVSKLVDKQKALEHKVTKHEQPKPKVVSKVDKQKAPEHKVTKHEQPIPKVHKVDKQDQGKHKDKTEQASTSKGPKNEHRPDKSKKHDAVKFQGDLYNFIPSPLHKSDPICYACGKHITCSLYHCEAKKRYLHPFCCRLKTKIIDPNTSYTLVQTDVRCRILCKKCNLKDDNRGLSYMSTTKDHRFHVYCFMEMVVSNSNNNVVVKGEKTEAFLETILSLTNVAVEGLTGGSSIFEFMFLGL